MDNKGKTYTKTAVRVIQELVDHAIATFKEKYNQKNPENKIDFKMQPTQSRQREEDGAIQFALTLQIKIDGLWEVLLRTTAWSLPTSQQDLALLTTELYRSMFVEIMHTGIFASLVNIQHTRHGEQYIDQSKKGSDPQTSDQCHSGADQNIQSPS